MADGQWLMGREVNTLRPFAISHQPIAGPGIDPGASPYESESGTCPACSQAGDLRL